MSNFLNYSVKSEEDIMDWVLMQLGYPLVEVEIHENQLRMCVNDALEEYTRWILQEEEYLVLDLKDYNTSGFTLPGNVTGIVALEGSSRSGGINTLFTIENTMQNSGITMMGGGAGGSWIDYEIARQHIELSNRMMAAHFHFEFNERIQLLTLIPNPTEKSIKGHIVVGCNVIRPEDQQIGESWVKRYTLALVKIIVGNVRSKFEGTSVLGGNTVNTAIKDEGIGEKEALLEEIQLENQFTHFLMG